MLRTAKNANKDYYNFKKYHIEVANSRCDKTHSEPDNQWPGFFTDPTV